MTLSDLLKISSKEQRSFIADGINSPVDYLYQLAGGHRNTKKKRAEIIEQRSQVVIDEIFKTSPGIIAENSGLDWQPVPWSTLIKQD